MILPPVEKNVRRHRPEWIKKFFADHSLEGIDRAFSMIMFWHGKLSNGEPLTNKDHRKRTYLKRKVRVLARDIRMDPEKLDYCLAELKDMELIYIEGYLGDPDETLKIWLIPENVEKAYRSVTDP
ncbi:hypothetical protein SH661x_002884 [Planctomicrobium sp. SH661]|uniref:hypothetical protein n=1 Tax=Planctomicrobium sp. SH661 TaxID=3448124 RepID=UPI003F5B2BA4